MKVIHSLKELSETLDPIRSQGLSIGFVPTMGALHQGHLSLAKRSLSENQYTVCSIFVNPTQFNNQSDLKNYPRNLEKDEALLKNIECDLIFNPSVEEIYPEKLETLNIDFGPLESVMEGQHRPGHFKGVAMVVNRLFQLLAPTNAYFGEKDFQQLTIVKALAVKLFPNISIVACPTFREPDGLAMSSRNELLGKEERLAAVLLSKTLFHAKEMVGKIPVDLLIHQSLETLASSEVLKPEYFELVDDKTLQAVKDWNHKGAIRACVACWAGKIRLIDTHSLKESS